MNSGVSLYLDAMRAVAALVVFFSHFAYARFSGGAYLWFREYNFGSDAVVVFFVLSGFLIAHAASRCDGAAGFATARIARLYSVVIPAIALTFALDAIGRMADPALYAPPWDQDGAPWREAWRAITFTNEGWGQASRLGTNGPYWSLAYEAWYYALFAAIFFTRRVRRMLLVALGAILAGPKILILAPCWAAGAVLHAVWMRGRVSLISRRAAVALIVTPVFAYFVLQLIGAPDALYALTAQWMQIAEPSYVLGFSNEFLWNYVIAGLVVAHLTGIIAAADLAPRLSQHLAKAIRWPAERSFALYLFHYPVLSCTAALLPLDRQSLTQNLLLFVIALAASYGLAEITERRLYAWRRWTDAVWAMISKFAGGIEAKPAAPSEFGQGKP